MNIAKGIMKMDSLLFLVNLIAMAYLCYWAVKNDTEDK
jgi:hypothetical protein